MKYIYILLLALSSFFINNSLHAKELTKIHAFFLPQDSVQSNTEIKELTPQKQIRKTPSKKSTLTTKQKPSSNKRVLPFQHGKLKKAPTTRSSSTALKKKRKRTPVLLNPLAEDKAPKKSKYTLEDNPNQHLLEKKQEAPATIKEQPKLSELDTLKQTEISDILESIPYPTNQIPSFKQLYENHVMDLRVLYRSNKILPSLELEKTLEKAKTLRRFEVTNK